jgi:hypothetical protein
MTKVSARPTMICATRICFNPPRTHTTMYMYFTPRRARRFQTWFLATKIRSPYFMILALSTLFIKLFRQTLTRLAPRHVPSCGTFMLVSWFSDALFLATVLHHESSLQVCRRSYSSCQIAQEFHSTVRVGCLGFNDGRSSRSRPREPDSIM